MNKTLTYLAAHGFTPVRRSRTYLDPEHLHGLAARECGEGAPRIQHEPSRHIFSSTTGNRVILL